jgi:hypothetical protein
VVSREIKHVSIFAELTEAFGAVPRASSSDRFGHHQMRCTRTSRVVTHALPVRPCSASALVPRRPPLPMHPRGRNRVELRAFRRQRARLRVAKTVEKWTTSSGGRLKTHTRSWRCRESVRCVPRAFTKPHRRARAHGPRVGAVLAHRPGCGRSMR